MCQLQWIVFSGDVALRLTLNIQTSAQLHATSPILGSTVNEYLNIRQGAAGLTFIL